MKSKENNSIEFLLEQLKSTEESYKLLSEKERKSKHGKEIASDIQNLRAKIKALDIAIKEQPKRLVSIISVGHGGKIAGKYPTKGKKFTYKDGTTIYEGEFNRDIKTRVFFLMNQKGYPYIDLVPEQEDISREEKIRRAKYWHKKLRKEGKNSFLIEIHSNAGRGEGCENYVCRGASQNSWKLARIVENKIRQHFPQHVWRGIKEKNWDICHLTPMPANLIEWFFMDNEDEKWLLTTDHGRTKIANCLFDIIETYFKLY